jgi:hypothetical protein
MHDFVKVVSVFFLMLLVAVVEPTLKKLFFVCCWNIVLVSFVAIEMPLAPELRASMVACQVVLWTVAVACHYLLQLVAPLADGLQRMGAFDMARVVVMPARTVTLEIFQNFACQQFLLG